MLHVLLIQLPVPSSPQLNTPLAAGYLKAYAAARGLLDRVRIELLPRALADRAGDAALVAAIVARRPDVLGLSLYTWNSERSLAVARRAKALLPDLLVVAGGPEVQPDNPWVLAHPALDVAVVGEGEQTFVELLEDLLRHRGDGGAGGWGDNVSQGDLPLPPGERSVGSQRAAATRSERILPSASGAIPGTVLNRPGGLAFAPERVPLSDLSGVPSPYLAGYLEQPAESMLMVEVSRWCPYSCSFCLYGRNMGPRLGSRYFGLERVLAEVAWGKAQGVRRVHFVEANLNLVPIFWPLMRALAELNADRQLTFYAELRGEHLTDAVVDALDAANVRVVEVGLQTANPAALRASHRRTDLAKWAAGTRRLYPRQIEVLLDVILGLPEDDAAGVAETLAFLERERLGPYDIFTLQVLPGTAVRREAARHGLRFQERPPYYVLATDRLSYAELRRLRRELKAGAGLDPDAIEGLPAPRDDALAVPRQPSGGLVDYVDLRGLSWPEAPQAPASTGSAGGEAGGQGDKGTRGRGDKGTRGQGDNASQGSLPWSPCQRAERAAWSASEASGLAPLSASEASGLVSERSERPRPLSASEASAPLAAHVDLILHAHQLEVATPLIAQWAAENPSTIFDLYLIGEAHPPAAEALGAWRAGLPFTPGYLDRVAAYGLAQPEPPYARVSPRIFLVLPWSATVEPGDYAGVAAVIWHSELGAGDALPLGAWRAAGGAGIWLTFAEGVPAELRESLTAEARGWAAAQGRGVWADL